MADAITHGETMNRLIHQAVRRDLGRFEAALDAFVPGDRSRAAALGEAFTHFDTMLTHHHEGEEDNLWPVIGDPAGGHEGDVATLTHEHAEIVAGLARLRAAATTHFAHEEAEMRGLMEGADPARLAAALKQMGRDGSPAEGLWFMQWVADGLTSQDSGELAAIIPGPVRLVSKVVAGRRYGRVRRAAFA